MRLLLGLLLVAAATVRAQETTRAEEPIADILVEHAAGQAVYVGAGSLDGMHTGDRLEVLRDGQPVALLEVVLANEHTSFCRLLYEFLPVAPGDLAIASTYEELTVSEEIELLPAPDIPRRLPHLVELERRATEIRDPSLSGTAYFRTELREVDDGDQTRGSSESTARISLVGHDLGHRPLTFRLRARNRDRSQDGDAEGSTSELRIYEMSLTWEPTDSRSWWQAGRIGSRQEVGAGYLDGIAGQIGLGRRWGIGGFAGLDPEIDDDLFGTDATKMGAFVTWATPRGPRRYGEAILAAIGEYVPNDVSREYVFLQTRFGDRGRWSIYQQAELDVNRGWRRELTGSSTALSNVSISGSLRLSERFRGTLSYNARRRYRDDDTRDIPEEAFDRLLREGLRGTLYYRSAKGLGLSISLGVRGGEGDVDSVDSLVLSASHGNLFGRGLLVGADFSTYRSSTAEGSLVTLRSRKVFRRGHDVGLTVGQSSSSSELAGDTPDQRWVRLDGTLQLPFRLFLLGEIEVGLSEGSETRETLQIGTRF